MAKITTFSTLKSAVGDFLDRSDLDAVGGIIDTLIGLAEAQIYRDLRIRFMESALDVTISSGVAAIPADFLELKHAYIDGTPVQWLDPKDASWIVAQYPTRSSSSKPSYIAPDVGNFIFGPFPDSGYTVKGTYYALPTDLSTTNETNFLTTDAPDVLLNATLLQSLSYLGMDERAVYWQGNYDNGLRRLEEQSQRERFPEQVALRVVPS